MTFAYSEILEKLIYRENLNSDEARWLMNQTMSGDFTPAQISAWLVALRSKGETSLEISTFAEVMREKAAPVNGINHPVLDTCGTGGDKSHLVNVSTISAIVLANRGIRVAKHGNRSVSSSSGSADILEKMGFNLTASADDIVKNINNKNFGFFFAPSFHPSMKFAGPVRKEIGIRTVFNILGPLSNPAHAEIHLLGVFRNDYIKILADALISLGAKTFMVVHSSDGLDEVSPLAPTSYCLYSNGQLKEAVYDPSNLNIQMKSLDELKVKNPEEALHRAQNILAGIDQPGIEMVALNTSFAEYLWDLHHRSTNDSLEKYIATKMPEISKLLSLGQVSVKNIF
jgi:anthranilate phosphoribosyltransferase